MENKDNLTITSVKTLDDIVVTLEFLQNTIKYELEPISKEFKSAKEVRLSLNKLTDTMNNFNNDLAKKVRYGSAEEIIVVLNNIENKVERLGAQLTQKYQIVLDKHQGELVKIMEKNQKEATNFEDHLRDKMIDRVKRLDMDKIERNIMVEIKKRLNYFPFEKMQSLNQVVKMEEHLKSREKSYDGFIWKIEEQNRKMKEIAMQNKEHIGILQIKYIVTALGIGAILGYTKFFYFFNALG